MRVPASPQPLIAVPIPRRPEAVSPVATAAGVATFSAPEVLRQALFEAPPPPAVMAPALAAASRPTSTTTVASTAGVPAPAPAVPAAQGALQHAALLAYVGRAPAGGLPPGVVIAGPPATPTPGPPSLLPAATLDVLQTIVPAPLRASRTDSLRQTAVIGLLRALVGQTAVLPESGLTTRAAPVPGSVLTAAPAQGPLAPGSATPAVPTGPAAVAARSAVLALASGDLLLQLEQPLLADGVVRAPLQAELRLHPTLIRHAPLLAAALAASDWQPGLELSTLHLPPGPLPQWLGFQLMVSPAALWPVMVCVASGYLHLPRVAGDDPDGADGADDVGAAALPEDEAGAQDDEDGADADAEADSETEAGPDEEPAASDDVLPFEIDAGASLHDDKPLSLGERIAFWIAVQRLRLTFR